MELARRFPLARSNRTRALAGNVAERAPERTQAFPARVEGDLGDRQIGVAEQRHRALDAPGEQVPVWRNAKGLLEGSREVSFGNPAYARQSPDGPRFVRSGVNPILCPQQPAQQLGVLIGRTAAHAPLPGLSSPLGSGYPGLGQFALFALLGFVLVEHRLGGGVALGAELVAVVAAPLVGRGARLVQL